MVNNENIDYLLQHLTSLLARNYDQVLDEQLGVGYAQYKILKVLSSIPNVKQRYIADMLGQTEASISRQMKILAEMGFLRISRDALNKRVHLISLTPKGEKITEAASAVLGRYNDPIFNQISDKQKANLELMLEALDKQICSIDHSSDFVRFLTNS